MNNIHLLRHPLFTHMKKAVPYLLVFFIPFLTLTGFVLFYASGYGAIVPGSLNLLLNLWNGFAAVCFYFYLKHDHRFAMLSETLCILLSVSYGISAYALLQENNIRYLTIFALFPLVFHFYQKMQESTQTLFYILVLSACILTDYMLGAIITVALTVYTLIFSTGSLGCRIKSFLHFLILSAISFLLSGIISFPLYAEYFSHIGNDSYEGFTTTLPLITALSRFLLGSVSSAAFFSGTRLDLYFGLFFFITALLFFFVPSISKKEKGKQFLFVFFLFSAIEFSPVYFIMNFFRSYQNGSVYYGFLLIFFLLLLSARALSSQNSLNTKNFTAYSLCVALYLTVCIYCAGHNYHPLSVRSNLFFALCYLTLLALSFLRRKIQFPIRTLLSCLICLELFCNIFIVTNQNFIHAPLELADHYPDFSALTAYPAATPEETQSAQSASLESKDTQQEETPESPNTPAAISASEKYIATNLMTLLSYLPDKDFLTENEKDIAGIDSMSDYFAIQNAICKKLGAREDLFLPANFTLTFADSDFYRVADLGNHIYSFSYLHDTQFSNTSFYDMKATIATKESGTLILLDKLDMQLYHFEFSDGSQDKQVSFYLPLSSEYTVNNQLNGYWLNKSVYDTLPELVKAYEESRLSEKNEQLAFSRYLGIAATCIGVFVMLLLFFNKDKDKIYTFFGRMGKAIEDNRFLDRFAGFFLKTRVYWFSFLIPLAYFIFCLIINSCMPFGSNSIFDEDGLYLNYPSNLDIYYNLKEGHVLYSFLGGYGYSLYAVNPLAITRIFTTIFSPAQLAGLLTLEEALYFGLSGLSLAFYLTHRLTGKRADKNDLRILIPVIIYTLNNYMLCMHGFTSWYQVFPAVPLLLLATDYLIIKKKALPYIIALAYCIYANLYLALYICIFLLVRFFMYDFKNVKDFLKKGLRFAGCSILAALNSFFIISNTLLASADSAYQIDDSTFPAPGLHGNFFSQWMQHMIFSEVGAVNWSESYVNLYAGIGTILLIFLFCTSKKIRLSTKLRTFIPMMILYISFNGKVLSYIWNGFHYQTGVPNRYAFLLMLCIAILSYDSICAIESISMPRFFTISLAGIIFFILCQFIGSGNSTYAFAASLIIFICYLCFLLYSVVKHKYQNFYRPFLCLLALEMLCNMTFAFRQFNLSGIYKTGNVTEIHDTFAEIDHDTPPLARTIFAATPYKNGGAFYETETNELFNSFVTMHQSNLNMRYGMTGGVNYLTTSNASNPLGVALSGTRFIYYTYITENPCADLAEYQYLGSVDDSYIFENPYTLPIGIYAPIEAASFTESSSFVPYFHEDLSSLYLPEGKSLFTHQIISYDETGTKENSFYYTDENDKILTFSEVEAILAKENAKGNSTQAMDNLYINISVTPSADGPLYLYAIEYISLGYCQEGKSAKYRISFPTANLPASNDFYNLNIFMSENMPEFYENASEFVLEDISYEGHTLTGTTNYEKDGYTMLSIPYERGWKAYIDNKEVEIEDPYASMMFIKTPAGHHELKLVFTPYGMTQSLAVTGGSIIFTCLLFCTISILKRKHPTSITKNEG